MSLFISQSECDGKQPINLSATTHVSRAHLITRLLNQRHVPRFLIAPSCFGKTTLMVEYARSVFSFKNVYWITSDSPCFLRDLDEDTILTTIYSKKQSPGLVVFDDVPKMNGKRTERFNVLMDNLMETGWEVMVAMTPFCDQYDETQFDRVTLYSEDLLVADLEIGQRNTQTALSKQITGSYTAFDRIPYLFWDHTACAEEFYRRVLADELSSEMLSLIFFFLIVEEGTLGLLGDYIEVKKSEILNHLEKHHLYLGVDTGKETFSVFPCPLEGIKRRFFPILDRLTTYSHATSKEELVYNLIELLISRDLPQRACNVLNLFSSVAQRKTWLEARGPVLLEKMCLFEAHEVYVSLGSSRIENAGSLAADEAWRIYFLGDTEGALRLAGRALHMSSADDSSRARAAALLCIEGNEASQKMAYQLLDTLTSFSEEQYIAASQPTSFSTIKDGEEWATIAVGLQLLCKTPESIIRYLHEAEMEQSTLETLLVWALRSVRERCMQGRVSEEDRRWFSEIVAYSLSYVTGKNTSEHESGHAFPFSYLRVVQSLEQTVRVFTPHIDNGIPPDCLSVVRLMERSLYAQQNAYDLSIHSAESEMLGDAFNQKKSHMNVHQPLPPMLIIKLFGGIDVSIGDNVVPPQLLSRQVDKTLLALLVLQKGKEMAREKIIDSIWPENTPETGKRNFYNTWARLRKALKAPDGDCPYLIRLQHCCKIDARLVSSDITEFDDVCKKLTFGSLDGAKWSELYERISTLYTDDLLPGEYNNELIVLARNDYRDRLIDACVYSAHSLIEKREYQAALWFARLGVSKDRTREDAQEVLMKAQMGAGQRTAALDTFFKYKGFLSEELGIDPSLALMSLYNAIIQTDGPTSVQELAHIVKEK